MVRAFVDLQIIIVNPSVQEVDAYLIWISTQAELVEPRI